MEPADVNSADNESQTPLMYAAASGSEQMIQTLLDAGADARAQTWSARLIRYSPVGIPTDATEADEPTSPAGFTALDIAKRARHSAVVELLEKAGAKPQ
jgi:ankyrin repeat protein